MSPLLKLNNSLIHIVGSVHSQISAVEELRRIMPSHLFVEATRETIGLVRRNPNHSDKVLDLPKLLEFSDAHRVPVHAMDTSASDMTARVFSSYTRSEKRKLWRYVLSRKLLSPVANAALVKVIPHSSSLLDGFVTRWSVAPSILQEARRLHSIDPRLVMQMIEDRQDISSFLSSAAYDPLAYRELCRETRIDEVLQSVLIDYRNAFMSERIRSVVRTIPSDSVCAVVVGKNHVAGMKDNLLSEGPPDPLSVYPQPSGKGASFIDQLLLAQLLSS